jgi:hypothetical protein
LDREYDFIFARNPEKLCIDEDGDGYGGEAIGPACEHLQWDCDDAHPNIHPGAAEDCTNGIDDNCNGKVDDEEPSCMPGWGAAGVAEAAADREATAPGGPSRAANWLMLLLVASAVLVVRHRIACRGGFRSSTGNAPAHELPEVLS